MKWFSFFKIKYILPLEENVSRVTELKKYLNDVVSRSRENSLLFRLGWDFFLLEQKDNKWNDRHSFKEMHIFLLDDNVSVSRVTELQKYLNDVVVRSWQNMHVLRLGRDSFLLKKKDRKWIDNHSFKTSTFSYWTRMCHVSHSLKYTFTMLLSGADKVR